MIAAITGLYAGLFHVFSGPDHLAAVAPLSIEHGRKSWCIGLRWGLGHSAGVLLLGLLLLGLRELLPLSALSQWAERFVGVVLIGIGLWGLRKALTNKVHVHTHSHGDHDHVHVHVHDAQTRHRPAETVPHHAHTHAVFAVGALHGLAGGSHFLGLLPALVFPTRAQTAAYVISYALGTIFAMASFATVVGWVATRCALGGSKSYRFLMLGCSLVAMLLGGYWLLGPRPIS